MPASKKADSKDEIGGDVIKVTSSGEHNAVAAGRGAKATVTHHQGGPAASEFDDWRKSLDKQVDAAAHIQPAEKTDLKDTIKKISDEGKKGPQADRSRLEKLVNTLGVMAPDIFAVATTTLANPLAGIGLVITKIGERAKIEAAARA